MTLLDFIKRALGREQRPLYQGQHDWPHDEATCGRCIWLRTQEKGYRYHPFIEPVTREDIDAAMDHVLGRLTGRNTRSEKGTE